MAPLCLRVLGVDVCVGGAPQVAHVHALAASVGAPSAARPPSYPCAGQAAPAPPPGYRVNALHARVASGRPAFARAAAALETASALHLPWVRLWRRGRGHRWAVGDAVVVAARVAPFVWTVSVNHVVAVRRRRSELAFSWGTSTRHSLRGEEQVSVALDPRDGSVSFSLRSFSRPRAPAAFLAYPLVVLLQRAFARDVCAKVARIANDRTPPEKHPAPADAALAARPGAAVRDGILRRHRRQEDT